MEKVTAGRENKPHIGIFGRCNTGKSTLLNFITGTQTAIVSPHEGTTTDLVRKSYEITGFSPVIFIDTGGIDDTSALSSERVSRTLEATSQVDLAIIVYREWGEAEERLADLLSKASVPFIRLHNLRQWERSSEQEGFGFDILHGTDRDRAALLELVKETIPEEALRPATMLGDMLGSGDTVILVCPIDSEAPAGRMILPQMQAVREALDRNAIALAVQPPQLPGALAITRPTVVVTDSQVYKGVRSLVPTDIEVTTFSILLAAAKGDMKLYTEGLAAVDRLRDGDRVLVAESCSHQISCDDIGRVKTPAWLRDYTGKNLEFVFATGLSPLPDDLGEFALMIQCGGCMATRSQLRNRIRKAATAGVPVTNYGMLIKRIR